MYLFVSLFSERNNVLTYSENHKLYLKYLNELVFQRLWMRTGHSQSSEENAKTM